MIRVIYTDKSCEKVREHDLEELITAGKIAAFHRKDGWVNVSRDPIRGKSSPYDGPERRRF